MFCSKCGNKLPNKSIYRNKCGAKILVENIKKEKVYDDTDNIDDQVHVKKKMKILVNVLLVFKNIIKNSKDYISKKQGEKKEMNIIVTCIFVIAVSIMAIIGCLNGMELLQIM
jgi:hypothetical protein